MKYSEYQVWFHAFNNAISALSNKWGDVDLVIQNAEKVADAALNKFKTVEMPEVPTGIDGFDLQNIVNSVMKKKNL